MKTKSLSKFYSVTQVVLAILLTVCATVWLTGHIAKGDMNVPTTIYAIAFLSIGIWLTKMAWRELKEDSKNTLN